MASWDHFLVVDRYPEPGSYEIVRHEVELPGGTTTNTAVALSRLGVSVSLTAIIGGDRNGSRLREALEAEEGIDSQALGVHEGEPTDGSTIIVSSNPAERTIYWHQGARLERGDRLDISSIFDHDVVLVDVASASLRRWLTDLPAHTSPRSKLLGTLTYIAGSEEPDGLDVALRHDVIVGSEREARLLTTRATLDGTVRTIQAEMLGANVRAWVISRSAGGCLIVTRDDILAIPAFSATPIDVTGAGDAFAAGIAYGMARRWDWYRTGRLANGLGALAVRSLGAQTALPTPAELGACMGEPPGTLFM